MVHRLYEGRVAFVEGDRTLAPGITLHLVGGHSSGLQVVRVKTRRGFVVLASDATHFYRNLEEKRPYPVAASIADVLDGYDKLTQLADSANHVIPGHDPLVLSRYPAAAPGLDGIVARLDADPH